MESKHIAEEKEADRDFKCDPDSKSPDKRFSSSSSNSNSRGVDSKPDDGDESSSILENFIKFTTSNNFVNTVQEFYQDNCGGFESYDELLSSGCGLRLEWMDTYKRFMDMVDLQLEGFCRIYTNLTTNQVFEKLQEAIDQIDDAAYVPLLIKSLDEQYFFSQMNTHAQRRAKLSAMGDSKSDDRASPMESSASSKASPFEGMWYADIDAVSSQFDNWLAKIGVPWAFRKIVFLAYSSRSCGSEFRLNYAKETFNLSSIIPVIGTQKASFNFNEWKSEVDFRGETHLTYCEVVNEHFIRTKIKRKMISGKKVDYLVVSEFVLEPGAGPKGSDRIINTRSLFYDCDESKKADAVLSVSLYR